MKRSHVIHTTTFFLLPGKLISTYNILFLQFYDYLLLSVKLSIKERQDKTNKQTKTKYKQKTKANKNKNKHTHKY